ncbi:tetratricopeptide repeat protein [Legionella jamestowniensis]|uniref:TPR repeat containing protein n=1 Tax=Legionella jamestowniensis TaxID=455 RepID=A0A0W0UIB9_9GAMM|nr:tetratricopeptide repeat protein [Legionella jamestowniensis]KTD07589.1 TPR repeat containing protein [Legionella jamestowniensis]OCH99337.1 hypothetical protein A8135_06520 [Legionella jamestowniensis]SFL59011.1 Ca-activated chloride channel family protein [Legionella jamestowniensis DSM 19215]
MKKGCLLLLLCVSLSSYSFNWRDLWFTKDQQGQTLMQKKQFGQAADTFQNQAWRGAAAYRAGNYKEAAKYYETLQNAQGFYNQANALAKLGQYENAVKAYDRALALNPNNKDAQYNRKLIAELLRKQQSNKQQDKNQQNQQDQQQQGGQQDKDQKNQNQQGNPEEKDQNNQQKQGNQQDKNQQNMKKDEKNQAEQSPHDKDQQHQEQKNDQQNKDSQNQEQKERFQDINQKNKGQQDKDAQDNKNNVGSDAQSIKEREKQQAKEQWLRLIPDDPGGLLREKFLRDHIRRQGGWYQ